MSPVLNFPEVLFNPNHANLVSVVKVKLQHETQVRIWCKAVYFHYSCERLDDERTQNFMMR